MLPDEPHAFSVEDEGVLRGALPRARVVRVSGKVLFWYGAWTIDALARLNAELADADDERARRRSGRPPADDA